MKHKDLNIWIETRSGAQHWQRAAFGVSFISGVLTGLFGFSLLFNTVRLPLAQVGELSIALSPQDAHSGLAREFFGYISAPTHLPITNTRDPVLFSLTSYTQLPETKQSVRLFSLFPKSYLASNGRITSFKITSYGILFSQRDLATHQSPVSHYSNYAHTSASSTVSAFELHFSRWEGDEESPFGIFNGTGEEQSLVSLLSAMNRPISTQPMLLSDGTVVRELRATPQQVRINTASGITTYASSSPYLLATQNIQTLDFTIRNTPSVPTLTPNSDSPSNESPGGSIAHISGALLRNLSVNNIVINIADKLSSNKNSTHLCVPVDKL